MSEQKATTFVVSAWDEKPVQEISDNEKIVTARVTQKYSGALQGESCVEYLMYYSDAENAIFTGFETFEGQYNGLAGRFVMVHNGRYENNVASSEWQIASGSASGELAGLTGSGSFGAGPGGSAAVTLRLKGT